VTTSWFFIRQVFCLFIEELAAQVSA